ncbi:MAG: NADPH-dependent FMN reductase, partial [Bacteriovorax sp.]
MFENIGVIVMPEQVCIPRAHEAFDEYGNLKNEILKKSIEKLGANLVDLTLRVRGFEVTLQ